MKTCKVERINLIKLIKAYTYKNRTRYFKDNKIGKKQPKHIIKWNNQVGISDEELYEQLKILCKEHPDIYMTPKEWKEKRLKQLRKEGGNWSIYK